jgi:8-oxo-dGTP diphosphatase
MVVAFFCLTHKWYGSFLNIIFLTHTRNGIRITLVDCVYDPFAHPFSSTRCLAGENRCRCAMKTIVQVTAAIIVNDGQILIAQRPPGDRLSGLWEFPGGKIEAGETPEQCLKRELWEELAMDAVIGTYLGSSIYHYDHISVELMAYRAFFNGSAYRLVSQPACRWVRPDRLDDVSFTPADLPFVKRLAAGQIDIGWPKVPCGRG